MIRFLRKLNLWVVLFTLCAYIAPFISPSQMSFLMFVGVAYPWLLVVNLIFLSIWAISRIRYWWYSAAVILVGWSHVTSVFGIHYQPIKKLESLLSPNTEGGISDTSFRVMSYNLHDCVAPNTKNIVLARLDLSRFLEKQNPDLLCLQEFLLTWGTEADNQRLNDIPFLKTYP